MEVISFRFLNLDDTKNPKYEAWSRIYEYPFVLDALTKLGASSNSTIHNTCWGFQSCHIEFKNDLDKLCNHINFKIQNKILSYSTELNDIIIPPCSSSVMLDKNKNIINCIDQFDNIKNKHEITIKFAKGYVTFNVSNIKVYK